jgi:hypothetical protein
VEAVGEAGGLDHLVDPLVRARGDRGPLGNPVDVLVERDELGLLGRSVLRGVRKCLLEIHPALRRSTISSPVLLPSRVRDFAQADIGPLSEQDPDRFARVYKVSGATPGAETLPAPRASRPSGSPRARKRRAHGAAAHNRLDEMRIRASTQLMAAFKAFRQEQRRGGEPRDGSFLDEAVAREPPVLAADRATS